MRKITREAADAFVNGRNLSKQNMCVSHRDGVSNMYLHGNLIAERYENDALRLTLAGWNTPTTRERLNGLLEVMDIDSRFFQRNFEPYFGNVLPGSGYIISVSEWIKVT